MEDSRDSGSRPNTKDDEPSDLGEAAHNPYIAELSSAKDVSELNRKILNIVQRLGFSDFMVVRYLQSEFPGALHSMPDEWVTTYCEQNFPEHDLALQQAKYSLRPFFRSTLIEYLNEHPFDFDHTHWMREIEKVNRKFGFFDFYYVPILKNTDVADRK